MRCDMRTQVQHHMLHQGLPVLRALLQQRTQSTSRTLMRADQPALSAKGLY